MLASNRLQHSNLPRLGALDTSAWLARARVATTAFIDSFRWASRINRDCEQWRASGQVLDGEAIRRIVANVERETGFNRLGSDE